MHCRKFAIGTLSMTGWDHVETIDSLMRKAGHRGQITLDIRKTIRLVRYRSEKLSVAFSEYAQLRRIKVWSPDAAQEEEQGRREGRRRNLAWLHSTHLPHRHESRGILQETIRREQLSRDDRLSQRICFCAALFTMRRVFVCALLKLVSGPEFYGGRFSLQRHFCCSPGRSSFPEISRACAFYAVWCIIRLGFDVFSALFGLLALVFLTRHLVVSTRRYRAVMMMTHGTGGGAGPSLTVFFSCFSGILFFTNLSVMCGIRDWKKMANSMKKVRKMKGKHRCSLPVTNKTNR